jgi:CheY-like chemotaxis protein
VLVVDDEPLIHVIVSRCLERAGFEVLHAMDGLQAVKLLSVAAEQPCLAITDMRMPHMGGAALGAWVRSGYPSTPILYISGYMDELPPPANEGSCQALAKPFTPEVLLEKVRELCKDTVEIRWGAQHGRSR